MQFIRTLIAILALINQVVGYLTQDCVAASSSLLNADSTLSQQACDNNFNSSFRGGYDLRAWLQLQLKTSVIISSVFVNIEGYVPFTFEISIRVGTSTTVTFNPTCSTIMQSGMYNCGSSGMTGNYIYLRRETDSTYFFGGIIEVRAYETSPFAITSEMLSDTSGSVNQSLNASLSYSLYQGGELYSTSSNRIWRVNFGGVRKVKAVLVITQTSYWIMTLGNQEAPSLNSTVFTSYSDSKDTLIESSGQYLSLIGTQTLTVNYVAVFLYPCSLNCSAVSLANQVYYSGETALKTIPACIGSSSTTQLTLTSTPTSAFTTVSKFPNNSFQIEFASSNLSLVGTTFAFSMQFSDTLAVGVCQPSSLVNVQVKCTRSVDCSASTQNNLNYFISETTELTIPACVVTPVICANTTTITLTSTGATTAPANFATITKNADGSFKIVLTSNDVSRTGQSYIFTFGFSDPSVSFVTLPSVISFQVAVKCTKIADCSTSLQSEIPFFVGQSKLLTILSCAISPSVCTNTTTGSLISIGVNTPAAGFATMTKNANNSFQIQLSSSDSTIPLGQIYQFSMTFSASDAVIITPPSNNQFSVTFCQSASLVATPTTVTIEQIDTPQTVELTNPTSPVACGSYTYAISPANDFIVLNASKITISPTLSTNPQTYIITATSTTVLSSPPLSRTTTISIVVNKCLVLNLTAASTIANQDYVLGKSKILVPIPSLTQIPACGELITWTLDTVPSFIKIEGSNIALFGSDLSQAGPFNVVLTATTSVSGTTIQLPFSVIARDCTPVNLSATPSTLAVTQLQAPAVILLSQTAGPSQCGSYIFSIAPTNIFVVLNGASITLTPLLGTKIQTYPIIVTSTMIQAPQLSATTNITITVNKCWVLAFTASTAIANQDYVLGQPKIFVAIPNLSQTPNCGDSVFYTLNTLPSFIQIEGTNVVLFGSFLSEAGTLNVVLSATASVSGTAIELPFSVIARDCTPVGLSATPSTLAVTQLQAPAAISLFQSTGPSQCGSYSFSITPANDFVVLRGDTLELNPTLETGVQAYPITVTSTMIDIPQLLASFLILVTVDLCRVLTLTTNLQIANQKYVLGSPKILIPIPSLTQTPTCYDSVLYSLNGIPSFVQIEGTNVALFGNDLTQAGTINAVLTASASVSGSSISFPFQIVAFDCVPVYFESSIYSLTLSQLSIANAMISQVMGPPECGQYIHALTESSPGFATLLYDKITISPQLADPLQDYTITAISTMVDTPYFSAQVSIILTVVCIVQKLQLETTETTFSSFNFKMGQRKEIEMPIYTLYPACQRTIVFRLDNTTKGYSANSFPSYLKYDEKTRLVVLNGENKLEAGKTYTFKYIVSIEIEQIVNMEYIFSIEVMKVTNEPPYFFPMLQPKTLQVEETTSWRLPDLVDPEGDSFDLVLVKLGSTKWITFEIQQNQQDITGRGSPKMQLNVDGKGAPGIYRFFIEVVDSGGGKLNAVLTVIIVGKSIQSFPENSKNAMTLNSTLYNNMTQALNSTNTTENFNSTNKTKDSNLTETNQTECTKTENVSCNDNKTADSNLTDESSAAVLGSYQGNMNQEINGSKPKFNGMNAKKPVFDGVKPKKKKIIEPKLVVIELNLLEWGCGAILKFSEPLIVEDEKKALKLFLFAILSQKDEETVKRNLLDQEAFYQNLKLEIEYAPDGKSITYKVNLDNPYEISVGAIINSLSVSAEGDQNFLKGKDGPVIIPKIPSLRRQLSAQLVQEDVAPLQSATEATANTSKSSIVLSAVVTVIIAGSLGLVWGLVGVLQNIGVMAYVNVNYPGNAQGFISEINNIASLALFPDIIFQPWIDIFTKNQEAENTQITKNFHQRFYQMGIETSHPINNLGQAGFFLFMTLAWMCFVLLVPLVCRSEATPCKLLRDKSLRWKKNLFWNGWIRLFVEIFQDMLIAGFVRLSTFEFGTHYEKDLQFLQFFFLSCRSQRQLDLAFAFTRTNTIMKMKSSRKSMVSFWLMCFLIVLVLPSFGLPSCFREFCRSLL